MQPLVSIALSTYNSSRFIRALLDSLLHQTWSNIEIVCCDDNSTDDTLVILHQYQCAHSDKFRLYFNESNIGYIKNFEKALSLCTGEFIAIADHDDIWMLQKIEKLISVIGDAMMVYSDSIYIDESGTNLHQQLTSHINLHDLPDPRSFVFTNAVWGHTVLINKQLLGYALPVPHETPYDLWLAYIAASVSAVKYLNEPLTYFRKHTTSYSAVLGKQRREDCNRKFNAWKEKMYWLQLLESSPYSKHKKFIQHLQNLYSQKEKKLFVWPLFWLLCEHKTMLFATWKRSYISSLNEIRKIARGI